MSRDGVLINFKEDATFANPHNGGLRNPFTIRNFAIIHNLAQIRIARNDFDFQLIIVLDRRTQNHRSWTKVCVCTCELRIKKGVCRLCKCKMLVFVQVSVSPRTSYSMSISSYFIVLANESTLNRI